MGLQESQLVIEGEDQEVTCWEHFHQKPLWVMNKAEENWKDFFRGT